jgi:hypothetical protein
VPRLTPLIALLLLLVAPAAAPAQQRSSFLLGVLPDTQFYSR